MFRRDSDWQKKHIFLSGHLPLLCDGWIDSPSKAFTGWQRPLYGSAWTRCQRNKPSEGGEFMEPGKNWVPIRGSTCTIVQVHLLWGITTVIPDSLWEFFFGIVVCSKIGCFGVNSNFQVDLCSTKLTEMQVIESSFIWGFLELTETKRFRYQSSLTESCISNFRSPLFFLTWSLQRS